MAMKLYGYFRSSAAFRVRIALNLKKLDYETAAVHLRRNDQTRPDYLRVNPQGLVPTLEHGDRTLIQSLRSSNISTRPIPTRLCCRGSGLIGRGCAPSPKSSPAK